MNELFRRFAASCSRLLGSSWAFILALLLVVVWGLSGPYFHYSDTWELVINTSTTIVTFLMVFLVQSTQNRDAKAIQLKLDELIRCVNGARDRLVTLESMSDEELAQLEKEFARLAGRKPKRDRDRSFSPAGQEDADPPLDQDDDARRESRKAS